MIQKRNGVEIILAGTEAAMTARPVSRGLEAINPSKSKIPVPPSTVHAMLSGPFC